MCIRDRSIAKLTAGEVVAIDGKTLCGTREAGKKALVHMVSAWASANNLVLGQRKVDEKSNEITAIPKLLNALELAGTVVTVDAMGCQRPVSYTHLQAPGVHLFGRGLGGVEDFGNVATAVNVSAARTMASFAVHTGLAVLCRKLGVRIALELLGHLVVARCV